MKKEKQINYRTDEAGYKELLLAARSTGISISQLIRLCISVALPELVKTYRRA